MTDDAGGGSQTGTAGADRSVPSPDASARDWARTRTSDATAPPPSAGTAAAEAAATGSGTATGTGTAVGSGTAVGTGTAAAASRRTAGSASVEPVRAGRPPLLVQGLAAALVAGLLATATWLGSAPLAGAVVVLQVALVLSVLAVLGAPAAGGAAVVAVGAGLAAVVVVVVDDGALDRLAAVVGLSLGVSLLHQLLRRGRSRVTESLADTMLAVVVAAAASCLVGLTSTEGGAALLSLALATAAAVLLAGRIGDRVVPRPRLAAGATRGWCGLVVGLVVGAALAPAVADSTGLDVTALVAALLGLAVAATVVTVDLAVDLGAAELRSGPRDARRVTALHLAAAALPYALLGPVVLLAGRVVLS